MEPSTESVQLPRDCVAGLYPKEAYQISACLESGCTRPPYECVFKTKPIKTPKRKPPVKEAFAPQWQEGPRHHQWKPHHCTTCGTTDEALFYPNVKNYCKDHLQAARRARVAAKRAKTIALSCRRCGGDFDKIAGSHFILCPTCRKD